MAAVVCKRFLNIGLVFAAVTLLVSCGQKTHEPRAAAATKTIFSFLGAPGSGKGTLSEQAVKQLGFKTVSTGNLCREEIASGSQKGKMIEVCTKSAQLVSDDVITEMVQNWLSKQTGDTPIILDGYPRTQKQAAMLADMLKTKFPHYRLRVISLNITDEDEVVKRISDRLVCEKCQAVYNRTLLKDPTNLVCEKCGGTLIQRADDKEEVVRKRLVDFNKNNAEIVAFYTSAGIAVEPLIVSYTTPQAIFENFKKMVA